jgi:hypothetical protein
MVGTTMLAAAGERREAFILWRTESAGAGALRRGGPHMVREAVIIRIPRPLQKSAGVRGSGRTVGWVGEGGC